jgi:tetratricopeptide (TPR) repeat protein
VLAADAPDALAALAHSDLEFRLVELGEEATADDYFVAGRFAVPFPDDPLQRASLIVHEFRTRARLGPVSVAEILRRHDLAPYLKDLKRELPTPKFVRCPTRDRPPHSIEVLHNGDDLVAECGECGPLTRLGDYLTHLTGSFLGKGEFGRMLYATQVSSGQPAALKLLDERGGGLEKRRALFEREARYAAVLASVKNVVHLFSGPVRGAQWFIPFEFIKGRNLRAVLKEEGVMMPLRAASVVEELARIVHAVHGCGVIHRDLKLDNVMIIPEGEVKLVDVGLATNPTDRDHDAGRIGTPAYMSPGQASGRSAEVDARSDVFALGIILYELLTGRRPFEAPNQAKILERVIQGEPDPIGRVNRTLAAIVARCLENDPRNRYPTAAALADDLAAYQRRGIRRIKLGFGLAAAAVILAVLAVLIVGGTKYRQARRIADLQGVIYGETERGADDVSAWGPESLRRINEALAELRGLEPAKSVEAEKVVKKKFHVAVSSKIASLPRLDEKDRDEIRRKIDAYSRFDQPGARGLGSELDARWFDRRTVAVIGPQAQEWKSIFPDAGLVRQSEGWTRPEPVAEKDQIVLSAVPCRGDLWASATFVHPDWSRGMPLGLTFNFERGQGNGAPARRPHPYGFLVVPRVGPGQPADAGRGGGTPARLVIQRDGAVLKVEDVVLPDGPLTLKASHDHQDLVLEAAGVRIEAREVIPLALALNGFIGVIWPAGARLTALELEERLWPVPVSPLQKGDAELAQAEAGPAADSAERYQKAITLLDAQIRSSGPQSILDEAAFKSALATNLAGDQAGAIARFGRLAQDDVLARGGDDTNRWPEMGACWHWALLLEAGRKEEADEAFSLLLTHHPNGSFAEYVPAWVPKLIQKMFGSQSVFYDFRSDRTRAKALDVAERVARATGAADSDLQSIRIDLLAANHFLDDRRAVEATAAALLNDPGLDAWKATLVIETAVWALLLQGKSEQALDLVNTWLKRFENHCDDCYAALLLFRAQAELARNDRGAARSDLDTLLGRFTPDQIDPNYYDATLLRGFIHEWDGEHDRAVSTWKRGLDRARQKGDLHQMNVSMLGSLSGALTLDDFHALVEGVLKMLPKKFDTIQWLKAPLADLDEFYTGVRDMWRVGRGREYAERIARKADISYYDAMTIQAPLSVHQILRQWAAGPDCTDAVDAEIWTTVEAIRSTYRLGKVPDGELFTFILMWRRLNIPGAPVLSRFDLPTHVRILYIFGLRRLYQGNARGALTYLDEARNLVRTLDQGIADRDPLARLIDDARRRAGAADVASQPKSPPADARRPETAPLAR